MRINLFCQRWRHGRGEIADDLLQDILDRHQPLNVAVFIDHDADFLFVALELHQLDVQRCAFGHIINFVGGAQQVLFVELFLLGHQAVGFAYPQHADSIVQ
ncbi:hypothetical protein D3C78_1537320 [compost metagenome]